MRQLLFFLLLLSLNCSYGQSADTSFGKPIFWYQVSNPWSMFMGAEGPLFILYNNGKIIFWKNASYKYIQLDEDQKNQLISEMSLTDALFQKSRFIIASDWTDNPSYTMSINLDTLVRVSVYGTISSKKSKRKFPKKFLKTHQFILDFDDDKAIKWIPNKIEIMLSDYSNSPDIPIKWPQDWPDLKSTDVKTHGGVTSLYLDNKYFDQLLKLLKERNEKQAFEINGNKYFIGYRFPMPGL